MIEKLGKTQTCTALSPQPIHFVHWVRARSLWTSTGVGVCRGRHPRRHLTISCPACGASSVARARGCPLGLRSPPPPRPFAFQTPASPALVPAPPVFCFSPANQNWAKSNNNFLYLLKQQAQRFFILFKKHLFCMPKNKKNWVKDAKSYNLDI